MLPIREKILYEIHILNGFYNMNPIKYNMWYILYGYKQNKGPGQSAESALKNL